MRIAPRYHHAMAWTRTGRPQARTIFATRVLLRFGMHAWFGVPILPVLWIPVALALLIDPNRFVWLRRIDPWLYWGTGFNLQYVAEFFFATDYFRRWAVTLPYALTHLLVGEAIVLDVLASFQLALLGLLIFWLNRSFGYSAPLAASLSVFVSANPFLYLAVGDGHSPVTRRFLDVEASRCELSLRLVSEAAPMPYLEQFRVETSGVPESSR